MSKMIGSSQAGGSQAGPIQRYTFENTQWNMTNGVSRSGDGAIGVVFFTDGSRQPLVTKASKDPPLETNFATAMLNKLGTGRKISAPNTRLATDAERGQIADQIEEKAMWNREEVASDVAAYRNGQPHVWVMGMASGHAFGGKRKMGQGFTESKLGGMRTVQLLEDPEYARRMGFVTLCDLFLGNGDRMDVANLGNWMTDTDGAISLIDNYASGSQKLTKSGQESWESSFKEDLKPSGYLRKAETTYNAITSSVAPEVKEALKRSFGMSPEGRKQAFIKHFAKGMADGRKAILAKLAPTFGKRSRSLKGSLGTGDEAAVAWGVLKRRALLLKNLK
ncbi:MAG TPA: hypothetical protein PKI89_07590 [Tepidiformaceae bacterium]|nr:hypothetical protein [Tepidiformaceae bacterium]